MAIITISREYGSGGDEIAAWVSEKIGYPLFGKDQIERAAEEVGLSLEEIVDFSEENHKVTSFLDRLFNRIAEASYVRAWGYTEYELPIEERKPIDENTMLLLVQKAIQTAHTTGNLVIVGRGSQVILRDQPDVMHVRIVAPLEERIQRVKQVLKSKRQAFEADMEIRREAQDLVLERDAASADYIKRFYSKDWNDPMLYHVILNTGKWSVEQAGGMIVDLAHLFK